MSVLRCPPPVVNHSGNSHGKNRAVQRNLGGHAEHERATARGSETCYLSASKKKCQISRSATLPPAPSSKTVSSASGAMRKSSLPVRRGRATFKKQGGAQSRKFETMHDGDLSRTVRNSSQSQISCASSSAVTGSQTTRPTYAPESGYTKCTSEKSTGEPLSTAKRSSAPLLATRSFNNPKGFAETTSMIENSPADKCKRCPGKVREVEHGRTGVGSEVDTGSWSENESSENYEEESNSITKCCRTGARVKPSRTTSLQASQVTSQNGRHCQPARKSMSCLPRRSRNNSLPARMFEPHIPSGPNASQARPQMENTRSTSSDHTSMQRRNECHATPVESQSTISPLNASSSTLSLHPAAIMPVISATSSLPVRPPHKANSHQLNNPQQTHEQSMTLALPNGMEPEKTCESEHISTSSTRTRSCALPKSSREISDGLTAKRRASQTFPSTDNNIDTSIASHFTTNNSCILTPTPSSHNLLVQNGTAIASNSSKITSLEDTTKVYLFAGPQGRGEIAKADIMPGRQLTTFPKEAVKQPSRMPKRDVTFLSSNISCTNKSSAKAHTGREAGSHANSTDETRAQSPGCIGLSVYPKATSKLASVCLVQQSSSSSTANRRHSSHLGTFRGKEENLISFREISMDPPSTPLPQPKKTPRAAKTTADGETRIRRRVEMNFLNALIPSTLPLPFGRSNRSEVGSMSGRIAGNPTSPANRNDSSEKGTKEVAESRTYDDDSGIGNTDSGPVDAERSLSVPPESKDDDKEILKGPNLTDGSCIRPASVRQGEGFVDDHRHHSFPPLSNPNTPSPAPDSSYGVHKAAFRYRRKDSDGSHEMKAGKRKAANRTKRCTVDTDWELEEDEVGGRRSGARCCVIL